MSELTVSVITREHDKEACSHCGKRAMIFNAQCFAEPLRPIITACKECITARAGGPEKVFVKTATRGLRDAWERNRKEAQPDHLGKSKVTSL